MSITPELKKLKKAIQSQQKPKKKQTYESKQDKILHTWIKENYGKKCKSYNDTCACCQAWRMYDYLKLSGEEIRTYEPYWVDNRSRTNKLKMKL